MRVPTKIDYATRYSDGLTLRAFGAMTEQIAAELVGSQDSLLVRPLLFVREPRARQRARQEGRAPWKRETDFRDTVRAIVHEIVRLDNPLPGATLWLVFDPHRDQAEGEEVQTTQ